LPQSTTAALLDLLRGQAATLTKEFRLTPVTRRAVVIAKGSEVGAYALIVVHETIIGTRWGRLGGELCHFARCLPIERLSEVDNTANRICKEKANNSNGEDLDTEAKHVE
jgi:hypothetical protein